MTIYVDYDRTIHDNNNRPDGKKLGKPILGAKESLQQLKDEGHEIVVFTVRAKEDTRFLEDWFRYFGIPYDSITNIKGAADFYIDDKAIHFDNWEDTLNKIKEQHDCTNG